MAIQRTSQRTRSAGRPTLDQVAARAGVGRGTVSRVVNGSPQVSAARQGRRRAGHPGARVRAQPGRPGAGDPADRLGRAGRLRVGGAGLRRAVLRRHHPGHQLDADGDAAAAVAGHGPVQGRAGTGRAPPHPAARRRRAAAVAARRRPAADPARPARAAGRPLWPARRPGEDRQRPDELRRRGQRRRRPGRRGPPAGPGPPAGRRDRRPAGHGRRRRPG